MNWSEWLRRYVLDYALGFVMGIQVSALVWTVILCVGAVMHRDRVTGASVAAGAAMLLSWFLGRWYERARRGK